MTAPTTDPAALRPLRNAFIAVAAVALLGVALACIIIAADIDRTDHYDYNIVYYLFAGYDLGVLALVALLCGAFYLAFRRGQMRLSLPRAVERLAAASPWRVALVVSLLLVAFCWLGTHLIYQSHLLSMDEWGVAFQAKMLLSGEVRALIPEPWRPFGPASTPVFVFYHPATHSWTSKYLPVYAALKAGFIALRQPELLNPLLAALSALSIVGIARNLWPERRGAAHVALLLLVSSSQFLITSMSGYPMPAHLAFNLLWLWLYSSERSALVWLAPWVGFLALGLHQPPPHALFVLPFCLRILLSRRWLRCAYYAAVYLVALYVWYRWLRFTAPDIHGVGKEFGLPGARQLLSQGVDLGMLVGWQALPVSVLAIYALSGWKKLRAIERDIALSGLCTLAFYVFYLLDQGHGWGYRYFHGSLGNLVLLAVVGYLRLRNSDDARAGSGAANAFIAIGVAFALLLQLPLRAYEAHETVAPYALAKREIERSPHHVVAVQTAAVWYGQDLVRNDPGLTNKPKVMFLERLGPRGLRALVRRGYRVRLLLQKELVQLGFKPTARRIRRRVRSNKNPTNR